MLFRSSPVTWTASCRRVEGAQESTIAKELVTLRAALKLAVRAGLWLGNPAAVLPVGFSAEYRPRSRFLTRDELQRLLAVLDPNGAAMVALDAATGAVAWKGGNDIAAYAAPMLATIDGTRQVVNFMADAVVGFDANTGTVLWRHPLKTAFARHVMTPLVLGSRVIVGSHQTGLIGLGISRTGNDWAVKEKWVSREAAPNFSCPVAVGGRVYGLGPQRDVVCLDAQSGAVRWTKPGLLTTPPDKAHAGFVVVGDRTILMLTDGGELVLFAADGAGYRELGRAQICGSNWCNPALVDGRLYLRDGIRNAGSWWCVEL